MDRSGLKARLSREKLRGGVHTDVLLPTLCLTDIKAVQQANDISWVF